MELIRSILIVKASSLGDIIHVFPCLTLLRNRFPNARIDWVVEQPFAELVQAHPFVNRAYVVQTKKWRQHPFALESLRSMLTFRKQVRQQHYDVIFDLQGNLKSGLLAAQAKSTTVVGFGSKSTFEWPNLFFMNKRYNPPLGNNVRDDYLFLVQSFLRDFTAVEAKPFRLRIDELQKKQIEEIFTIPALQGKKKVLVCPGANWRNKQLNEESLLYFLQEVRREFQTAFLFAWGSEQERALVERLHQHFLESSVLIPKLSLPTLQNLMQQVDMVVAMDSLPLHLAGTTTTPTFSIFGPSSASKYKPQGNQHYAFQGSCPYGQTFERRCPILRTCETGRCIRGLPGKELFQQFQRWHASR